MALKLMYITNDSKIAQIAESAGVDRIFIDLEYIGKDERQANMDTVQSHHTIDDVKNISNAINDAELLVRINPIHNSQAKYGSTEEEIDAVIKNGADIIMLPYFKTLDEVKEFLKLVDRRVKTMLLVETPESVTIIDDILDLQGIDYIHIGLNDLSLGYGKKFMFELLSDGTVEKLCKKIAEKGIEYGFGGIASLGKGMVPAEMIIKEHYRLGSTCAILSRSFCNTDKISDINVINATFVNGVREIRKLENECEKHICYFMNNKRKLEDLIEKIIQ